MSDQRVENVSGSGENYGRAGQEGGPRWCEDVDRAEMVRGNCSWVGTRPWLWAEVWRLATSHVFNWPFFICYERPVTCILPHVYNTLNTLITFNANTSGIDMN